MSEHGFLRPNPALFDLEDRKRKPRLAHELGAGSSCSKCGDRCPGFQLHYWRKVCTNCRCGKAEHEVVDEHDPGFYFVGKIFDRPLRTKEEELEFCYGGGSDDSDASSEGHAHRHAHAGIAVTKKKVVKKVRFDWVPPNTSQRLARRYLEELPAGNVPIAGSSGAQHRRQQLERQFPVHDVEPDHCHELSNTEIQTMRGYIDNVKENVAGQAIVTEVDDDFPPPPPPLDSALADLTGRMTLRDRREDSLPPPPPLAHRPKLLDAYGSTSSSRHASPSPTSSTEGEHHHHASSASPSRALAKSSITRGTSTPVSQLSCAHCGLALHAGDVAVRAERAGKTKVWHPKCFKCFTCQSILVDLLYYYHGGQVYCARDYAEKAGIPRCAACDELIFAAEYTGAENRAWHVKHFCCFQCDRPLAGHKYIPVNEQPWCLLCYQSTHGKVCRACGEYIAPEEQRVSLGNDHWHARPDCFCCVACGLSLIGRKMTKRNDLVLCSSNCARKISQLASATANDALHASIV